MQDHTVLIMAAGTGGHIFPALALAEAAKAKGMTVHWLGTVNGMENKLVHDFPLHRIAMKGVRHKGLLRKMIAPFSVLNACWQAARHIRRVRPDRVIGFGGYVTVPGGLAAFFLKKRLVIHEQNACAGLSNRLLAKVAYRVCSAFPNTFKKPNVIDTGNPVRSSILALDPPRTRYAMHQGPLRILVLGGSRGASVLNEQVPQALVMLDEVVVRHQTGERDIEKVRAAYAPLESRATVQAFIEDMAEAYAWADLVICRAGALTVSELMAAGLPAIFIPYAEAVDDHQTKNANVLVEKDAARLLPQSSLTRDALLTRLNPLLARDVLLTMAERAYALRRADAVNLILDTLS